MLSLGINLAVQMKQLLSGETLFAPEILGDWYTGEQVDAMFLNSVPFLLDNMCDSWCRLGSTGAAVLSPNLSMSHFSSFNYPRPGLSFFICSWARKERECSPSSSLSLLKGMRQVRPSKEGRHSLAVQSEPGLHV